MALTVEITDNANGTGATATIAGSSGGTVFVYVGRVSGEVGATPFTSPGWRTGNGTLALALTDLGLYFGYAIEGGVIAPLYYFPVTNGTLAVASRVRKSVLDTIGLLTIPPAQHRYEQMFPEESNIKYPCVIATVDGVQETSQVVLNNRDTIGRPVKVMICDRADKFDHRKLPVYELWRQSIDRCFREQQLAGVPESVQCKIEPYVIVDPDARHYQHMVSGLVIRAYTREPRGVGV